MPSPSDPDAHYALEIIKGNKPTTLPSTTSFPSRSHTLHPQPHHPINPSSYPTQPNSPPPPPANARLLYGRHQTYDIAISQPKFPGQSLGTPRYHGQKIHALLIGYTTGCTPAGKEVSGKLLRGTYSMGLHKNAPKVGDAIQILHEEVAADVEGLLGELFLLFGGLGGL
jgi:hypothetical protein